MLASVFTNEFLFETSALGIALLIFGLISVVSIEIISYFFHRNKE
tara:strand:- start:2170 stop:2304 length:135 start_codon:yes stop_codon:yes gene_type:complete